MSMLQAKNGKECLKNECVQDDYINALSDITSKNMLILVVVMIEKLHSFSRI